MINQRLKRYLLSGLIGNALFVLFILLCLLYYAVIGGYSLGVEIFLYAVEISGFLFMICSDILLCLNVQGGLIMKIAACAYTAAELVLMILELGLVRPGFYDGMKKSFVVVHVIVSVLIMMTYLLLEPGNRTHELSIVGACVITILGVLGYRVYLSMIFNACAYIFIYGITLFNVSHEKVTISCKGDIVLAKKYKSSFFE